MARKKRPAFGGLASKEADAKAMARAARSGLDAYSDLEDVRAWAREGRVLLKRVLARFPEEISAIRGDGDWEMAEWRALICGNIVRDYSADPLRPLRLVELLLNAETIMQDVGKLLPASAIVDGTDAADEMLRSTMTVAEVAIALDMSPTAIEKRRERRKRRRR